MQVDKGAIPFILKGSDIMAPGLISEGAKIDVELEKDVYCVC